jgi:hypothetical protein
MSSLKCEVCNYAAIKLSHYKEHLLTEKHIENVCQLPKDTALLCGKCNDYTTTEKWLYRRHISTCKGPKNHSTDCPICHKHFDTKSGLFKHKKKCVPIPDTPQLPTQVVLPPDTITGLTNAIVTLTENQTEISHKQTEMTAKQTAVLQSVLERFDSLEQVVEILKTSVANTVINNTHNGDNNMTLNVFLNEKCKDAMNIMDFVQSIKISPQDLVQFNTDGYVGAMSNIMVSNLNNLPLTQRPVHCTDVSRQSIHIKHENKWHHEDKTAPIMAKAVYNLRKLCCNSVFTCHPDRKTRAPGSLAERQFHHLVSETSGGRGSDEVFARRNNKIVTSICKGVRLTKKDMLTL